VGPTNADAPATIAATLRAARARLASAGGDTPGLDAEVLLRHVLDVDRASLFARLPEAIAPAAAAAFQRLLAQRAAGIPVAYLTGQREFMGLTFSVEPGVLVPRPETEILVEWALGWLRAREPATAVDVGAGSGAIALSLAHHLAPEWSGRLLAADISPAAIAVVARNRRRLQLEPRVALVQGSLTHWLRGPVDLLLANLPYLRPEQLVANPELAAEPRQALAGGEDGLDLIRELLTDSPRVLAPHGALGIEIDPSQREAVAALARATWPSAAIQVLRDLAGRDRHVIVETA
jgi:release factor glutamine methyltransferase